MLLYQDDAKKINQFFIKLLKPLPGWRLVSQENWFESLAKEYKKRDLKVDFPVPSTSSTILTIPLLERLKILRNLCEFHLEQSEHFWELLKVKDGESDWRIEPIGKDSQNRRYWLFSDARLYREIEGLKMVSNSKTKKSSVDTMPWDIENENNWELVCLTRADYDEFMNSFTADGSVLKPKDKSFLKMIREEIIPKVEPILNFQLSQHRKYFRPVASERIFLLPRKRSSRLLEKELEEEQRRIEMEQMEKEADKERQAMRREQHQTTDETKEQIEKDLAAEREMRAEMRRLKKEKEMQIKEIEEAFYSNYNDGQAVANDSETEENVDIISEGEEEIVTVPKSPVKIVFKVTKPEEVKEEIVDIVEEHENTNSTAVSDAPTAEEAEDYKIISNTVENEVVVNGDRISNEIVSEDNNTDALSQEDNTQLISNSNDGITEESIINNILPATSCAVPAEYPLENTEANVYESSESIIDGVSYEDADLLQNLSNNN